jgi:MFS family permease
VRLLRLSPGISRREFWEATAANFLFFFNISSFNLLPLYISDLGGAEARIGWIMGVYSLAAFIFLPVIGRWVERVGIKPLQVVGGATGLVASASFVFLTELSPLFSVLRILQGFGYSAFFVANLTLIAEIAPPRHRAETVGIFGISGLLTMGLAPAVGELVIQAYGYQVFFLFAASFSLAGLLVVALLKPPEIVPVATAPWGGITRAMVFLPLLISVIFGICHGTLYAFFPPFAKGVAGVHRVGGFYIAYAFAAIGIRVIGRRWADAWGRYETVIPALLLFSLGVFLLLWPGPLRALFWVGGLTGSAHGVLYPTLAALLVDQVEPGRRGRVLGLFSSAIVLGTSLGPMTMGLVAQEIGYEGMFGLTGLLPLFAVILVGFSLGRTPQGTKP